MQQFRLQRITSCIQLETVLLNQAAVPIPAWCQLLKLVFFSVSISSRDKVIPRIRKIAKGLRPSSTALGRASRNGHLEVAGWLIEHGASVELPDSKSLDTPLITATYYGHASVVKMLPDSGASWHLRRLRTAKERLLGILPLQDASCPTECLSTRQLSPSRFALFSVSKRPARVLLE